MQPKPVPTCFVTTEHFGCLRKLETLLGRVDFSPELFRVSRRNRASPRFLSQDGGADLNARDKWGRNALQVAREVKQATAIRLLEEAGAK